MLFQFLKVDISFVSAMCHELSKCYNLIQRAFYCSFVAMTWQCALNKKLHCMYTGQHKLCTDTNTVLDIIKATSFLLYSNALFYLTWF